MKEFSNKKEMETKLNEISQRICNCDFIQLEGESAIICCLLEAKEIITPKENEFIKETLNRGLI